MIAPQAFGSWLRRYGEAWIAGDPWAALKLFTDDAAYYETPFEPPMVGSDAIRRYWTEGAQDSQRNVTVAAQPIGLDGDTAYARWQATFERLPAGSFVELDGVLAASFAPDGRCREFREWWHRRETPMTAR